MHLSKFSGNSITMSLFRVFLKNILFIHNNSFSYSLPTTTHQDASYTYIYIYIYIYITLILLYLLISTLQDFSGFYLFKFTRTHASSPPKNTGYYWILYSVDSDFGGSITSHLLLSYYNNLDLKLILGTVSSALTISYF